MNIAFLLTTLNRGGIEKLSCFLANEMVKLGHFVLIISMKQEYDEYLVSMLDERIKVAYLNGISSNKENVYKVNQLFIFYKIRYVINQYGLPYIPCRLVRKANKGEDIKLISVYHSDPSANGRILSVKNQKDKETGIYKRIIFSIKEYVFRLATRMSMRYVYNHSDAYVLLSDCFRGNFIRFTGINNPYKLYSIPNPVTIDSSSFTYIPRMKKKQILFVGRIDNAIKRIDRVLDVWKGLKNQFPAWELVILGDGPDLSFLKQYALINDIKHVVFKGKQDPLRFYEEASIILLTSEFEGFGLVLVEGMTFGVVPVAYGSYEAVYDIIEDGINGYVVRPKNGKFPLSQMIERVKTLMEDEQMRDKMAQNSLNIKLKFGKQEIIKRWLDLFSKLH